MRLPPKGSRPNGGQAAVKGWPHTGRSGNVAASFLEDYTGVVQTNGYAGYDFLDRMPDVAHAGCWAHAVASLWRPRKEAAKGAEPELWTSP